VTGRTTLQDALSFAGVMLIASIPFAVQLVMTGTIAAGFRSLADRGAIVTRPAALEELAGAVKTNLKRRILLEIIYNTFLSRM
jgi:magnesium-transporting ATPase (P-type)